jgi:hypothetical protein
MSWPGKKQSRADFPFNDVWISYEISPNGLFEREIGSAVFLARPTQTQTAFITTWIDFGCVGVPISFIMCMYVLCACFHARGLL